MGEAWGQGLISVSVQLYNATYLQYTTGRCRESFDGRVNCGQSFHDVGWRSAAGGPGAVLRRRRRGGAGGGRSEGLHRLTYRRSFGDHGVDVPGHRLQRQLRLRQCLVHQDVRHSQVANRLP